MRGSLAIRFCLLALAGAAAAAPASAPVAAITAPEAIVREFNRAISERNLDAAIATLAPGAVKFNFGSAHSFSAAPGATEPLTSDLAIQWRTVAPVLYAANRSYERRVEAVTTHVEGSLAVVWARLTTTTEAKSGVVTKLEFAETYVLQFSQGHWRIAGTANARPTR